MIQTVLTLTLADDLDHTVDRILAAMKFQPGIEIKPDWQNTFGDKANAVTADINDLDRCIDITDLYIILFEAVSYTHLTLPTKA